VGNVDGLHTIEVIKSCVEGRLALMRLKTPPSISKENLPLFKFENDFLLLKSDLEANRKTQSSLRLRRQCGWANMFYEIGLVSTFFIGVLGYKNPDVYWAKMLSGLGRDFLWGWWALGKLAHQ
jgi:hypothetical protein